MMLEYQPRPMPRFRARVEPPAAVVEGNRALGVQVVDGGPWVRWDFDAPVAGTGEAGAGLLVGGNGPAAVNVTPGDPFVFCLYPVEPVVGTPWFFAGPSSEVTFEDGRPGVPGSGVCTAE
jgi:hypothetical protein